MKRASLAPLLLLLHVGCTTHELSTPCTRADCVAKTPPKLRYAIELVPPKESTLVREQRSELTTDEQGNTVLAFGAPVVLSGRVFVGDPSTSSILAHVSAKRSGPQVIPGRSLIYETDSTAGVGPGGASYSLALVPGTYTISVTPRDAGHPPLSLPITVLSSRALDLVLPGPSELEAVTGRVTAKGGGSVAPMTVQIEDSHRLVSTVGTTSPDGSFSVLLPRMNGVFTLQLAPAEETTPLPTLRRSIVTSAQGQLGPLVVELPALAAPRRARFPVVTRDEAGTWVGAAGVQVSIVTTFEDPQGEDHEATYRRAVRTDTDGIALFDLFPGTAYEIDVQTSPSSSIASAAIEPWWCDPMAYGDPIEGQRIELGAKTPVSGTLFDSMDRPVAGAVIEAYGVTSADAAYPGQPRSSVGSAVTDTKGHFRLLVEGGKYDLEVTPPEKSSFPRWAQRDVEVGIASPEMTLDIHLPQAHRIAGRVTDANGKPQGDVDIRIYLVIDDEEARLRGQARSTASGMFQLVLPSPEPE